tara:strand:- start:14212 stop:15060 length:849 start_codon:yes stop_codon:yes gene_type:complete
MKGLVVGGGGFIGMSYCGAVQELHKLGHLQDCTYFSGSSIGSLVCVCYLMLIYEENIEETFKDVMIKLLDNYTEKDISLKSFFFNWGIYKRDTLKEDLHTFFKQYTNNYNPTFKEFFMFNKKTFLIAVSNITKHQSQYMSHLNVPDVFVIDAILASTCIPFICEKVIINDEFFCDGCVFDQIPINPLLNYINNNEIIAIHNSSSAQKNYDIKDIKNYFLNIFYICSVKQICPNIYNLINVNNKKVPLFTLDFEFLKTHLEYSFDLGKTAVNIWNENYLKKLL